MASKGSHLDGRGESNEDAVAWRSAIPLLLGALVIMNVASVVMVLIE